MIWSDLLRQGIQTLTAAGIPDAPRDARRLAAHVMGIEASRITLIAQDTVPPGIAQLYDGIVAQRARRVPVSHLTGSRQFHGRVFEVTPDVLDPRPETEILIETALARPWRRVLDLGTGSGCILLTLLAERGNQTFGIGTDLSRYEFHRPAHPQHPQLAADRVHVLSKALGWDCAPHIVEALGGMTSMLSHGVGPPLPTALDDVGLAYNGNNTEAVQERLAEMADAARERREHEEAERAHFQAQMEKFSPDAPKKRERRGAATAAERAIAEASMHAVNVDGSVKKHFRLRCSRKEREVERHTVNKHLKRAQKQAGGSEEWHRLGEEATDLDFEPPKPRKRIAKSPPAAAAGAPSKATTDLSAFLAAL